MSKITFVRGSLTKNKDFTTFLNKTKKASINADTEIENYILITQDTPISCIAAQQDFNYFLAKGTRKSISIDNCQLGYPFSESSNPTTKFYSQGDLQYTIKPGIIVRSGSSFYTGFTPTPILPLDPPTTLIDLKFQSSVIVQNDAPTASTTLMSSRNVVLASPGVNSTTCGEFVLSTPLDGAGFGAIYFQIPPVILGSESRDFLISFDIKLKSLTNCSFFKFIYGLSGFQFLWNNGELKILSDGLVLLNYVWSPSINSWYNLAIRKFGGQQKLYINNVLVATTSLTSNSLTSYCVIGNALNNSNQPVYDSLDGYIDNFLLKV